MGAEGDQPRRDRGLRQLLSVGPSSIGSTAPAVSVRVGFSPERGLLDDRSLGAMQGVTVGDRFSGTGALVVGPRGARFAVREHRAPFWIALWIAIVVAEALALRPVLFDREAPIQGIEVVFTLVGGSFAACGLLAWRRRPDSRSGLLMVATGFLFFVAPLLGQLEGELASTLWVLFVDYWIFPFVTLILTLLTSGRLQTRFDRLLVASYADPAGHPAGRVDDDRPRGGPPAARLPERGRRARDRPGPARDARGLLPGRPSSWSSPDGGRRRGRGAARCCRASPAPSRCCASRRCSSPTWSPGRARRRCCGSRPARS